MQSYYVTIRPSGKTLQVEHGTCLQEVLAPGSVEYPCGGKGICGKCKVRLLAGKIGLDEWHRRILEKNGLSPAVWRLACRSRVTGDIVIEVPERDAMLLSDDAGVNVQPETGYGIAVDLGSTTIVVQLLDLNTGAVEASLSELNGQGRYGADIVSRIAFAIRDRDSLAVLSDLVRRQVGRMIRRLSDEDKLSKVKKVVLVGNSVMHHLFCRFDLVPLSKSPFRSSTDQLCCFTAGELGWELPAACRIMFMPNMGSFVGSDILAGIEALQMHRQEKWQALIDLGTNGEIAIGCKWGILFTSTAAGPAFEGVHISRGMRAVTGAIYKVDAESGRPEVLGGVEAAGICGSGLVDAIHYFRQREEIDMTGTLVVDPLSLTSQVAISAKDVREFQLAKAAVATGFLLLLRELSVAVGDIEHIYIAGGLGHYLNIDHALSLGLLQAGSAAQVRTAGNAALAGCKRFLYDSVRSEAEEILRLSRHYSLEGTQGNGFQDLYCEQLFFS